MAGFRWTTPPEQVWPPGAAAYMAAIRRGVHGVMQRYSAEIAAYMKTQAPWTDRSGSARQALYTEVNPPSPAEVMEMIELIMAHGVIHGWYLEGFKPDGTPMIRPSRFQIIEPTLDHFGPRIWADIQKVLS